MAIPEIKYVEFTSNKYIGSQTNEGGIIYNDIVELQDDAMRLKVTECIFKYNEAPKGSAIYWQGGALIISNSIFEGNISTSTASFVGGAINFRYLLDSSVSNATIGEFSISN